jgi:hypothetical protein
MIKGITQAGRYVAVNNGTPGSLYMNSYSGQTMVGQIRWNPNTQNMEVYDGVSWISMPTSYPTVGLTWDAEQAIDWAINKKKEEAELEELCKRHPSVAEAYERLQILKVLTKQQDQESEKK